MAPKNKRKLAVRTRFQDNGDPVPVTIEDSSLSRIMVEGSTIHSCKLLHVVLQNCTISASDLNNFTTVGCTTTKSKLADTDLIKSNFLAGNITTKSSLKECNIRDSKLADCDFENSEVRNSEIIGGKATGGQFHFSHLNGTTTHKSQLISCSIEICDLYDSTLSDPKLLSKTSMRNCSQTTIPPLSLLKFPPEIRALIFKHAIHWKGTTPPFIKALRGDIKLHHEAMEILCKYTVFKVHRPNSPGWINMSNAAWKGVRNLSVDAGVMNIPLFPPLLVAGWNLRVLHLDHVSKNTLTWLDHIVHTWLNGFNSIERFSVKFTVSVYDSRNLARDNRIHRVMEDLNWGLGVQGLLETVETWSDTTFFWKAEKGKVLRWMDLPATS